MSEWVRFPCPFLLADRYTRDPREERRPVWSGASLAGREELGPFLGPSTALCLSQTPATPLSKKG
jgi:hypothetical protein